jgi:hypothetical protein
MEFGNVRWCSDPALLDPRLRKAGLSIEARQKAMIGCTSRSMTQLCVASGSPAASVVERSDRLMREATTNGALFLAFAANGPERNSLSEEGSLLHVLCQGSDDTKCKGPTAAQAEFRSASGTFPRMIGLALVAVGVLGMVMLFGLIALRLFTAAIVSLFMLLLAPAAVLAPALGETGRAVFGLWLTRLLGAVGSKLIYSFLLGVLLMMQRLIGSIEPLGWWTQWLLISTFWWAVFFRRHQAAALLQGAGRDRSSHGHRSIARRMDGVRQAHNAVSHPVSWAKGKLLGPQLERPEDLARRSPGNVNREAGGVMPHRHARRVAPSRRGQPLADRSLARQAQLARLRGAREAALEAGDRRRAAKLAIRGQRIQAELEREPPRPHTSARVAAEHDRTGLRLPPGHDRAAANRPARHEPIDGQARAGAPTRMDGEPARDRSSGRMAVDRQRPSAPLPSTIDPGGSPEARRVRSSIMDDARAVAEKRKRQLGFHSSPAPGLTGGVEPAGEDEPSP